MGYANMTKRLFLMICLVGICLASQGHYEGGAITWSADPVHPQNVDITFQLNFKHSYTNGYLHEPCTRTAIETREVLGTEGSFRVDGERVTWAKYICTAYDEVNDWSMGSFTFTHTLAPGQTSVSVNYEECCWLTEIANNGQQVSTGRGWNLASTVDITPRTDTIAVNNPPMAASIPVFRMNKGCQSALYIPAWDNDGDIVRCRWTDPEKNECNKQDGDVCGQLYVDGKRRKPGADIEEDTCKLTFRTKNPKGTYAVSVMIEDFAPSDLATPLSKIPLQFLVEVVRRNGNCRKPVMLEIHGKCVTIPAGQEKQMPITARSSSPDFEIIRIDTIKPLGITVSPLTRVEGSDTDYYVMMTWTPSIGQIGRHVICYKAEEEGNFYSDMACVYINVVDPDVYEPLFVVTSESVPAPGSEIVERDVRIQYNKPISRPDRSAFISVLDDTKDEVIFTADASSETDVTFEGNALMFALPANVPLKYGNPYRIRTDAGAVKPTEACGVAPSMDEWSFTWNGRKLPGKIEDSGTVREQPSSADCRGSFMQIFVSKQLVGEIDPSTMYLNDPTCKGSDYNVTHYVIGTSYDMCQTSVKGDNRVGLVTFENTVFIPPQPYTPGSEITRDHNIEIHMSCRIHSDKISYLSFDPNVTTVIYYEEGYGNFDFSLDMYDDIYYTTPTNRHAYPEDVELDQALYFEARINCNPEQECDQHVMIDSCWATPTTNPFYDTRFVFIQNGCSMDDTVQFLTAPSNSKNRFSIHSFAFLGEHIDGPVYVHCEMSTCDVMEVDSNCGVQCDEPVESADTADVIGDDSANSLVRRSRRDVTGDSSSSTSHIATRQLRQSGDNADAPLVFNHADVVEIAMLGSVIALLMILIGAQCLKQNAAAGKTTNSV